MVFGENDTLPGWIDHPRKKHDNYDLAQVEANRLSMKFERIFYVLKAISVTIPPSHDIKVMRLE